jgi:GxxExxY protein
MIQVSDANIRMHTNAANNTNKLIYPELSYTLTGICFETHNALGRYSREKQYGDEIAKRLRSLKIPFERELTVPNTGNRIDFLIADKVVMELKAKRLITKEDYFQTQRYLQALNVKLGLIINFRNQYIKPVRIVKIETKHKTKFA